jgi:lysophospholipase L1-like esterase
MAIGDSITAGNFDEVDSLGWPTHLVVNMRTLTGGLWRELPARYAVGGLTTAAAAAGIDAQLASRTDTPYYVLILLGANDLSAVEADWKTNYRYILDAVHTKWSAAKIYCGKSYSVGQ